MKYRLILLLILTIPFISQAQSSNGNVQTQIIGNWIMSKHMLEQNGVSKDMWTSEFKATYSFKHDGTWMSTYWRKGYGTVITVGKWKVVDNGKKIQLYGNRFLPPHDKDGKVADHKLDVLKLSNSEFVTNEYMFAEDPVGTSYYIRTQ
jgi:hypothetical protein